MADEKNETMEDYKDEIEKSFRKINEGDVLSGTVIAVDDDKVTVDLQYYAPGIIRIEDMSDDPSYNVKENIHAGDEISATVIRRDDGHGNILLSRKEENKLEAWDKLSEMMAADESAVVVVKEAVKGGVTAFLDGVRGFIPASKLDLSYVNEDKLKDYVGKNLTVNIINCDRENDKLVLSAKKKLMEKAAEERKDKISNVQVGLVTEGVVENIQPYGAFIDLGNGLSGLVHISQICNSRIAHPSSVLKEGQKVKVKVIAVKDGKLSLSMKALDDVEATEITEEKIDFKSEGDATTSLAALLKNAGF